MSQEAALVAIDVGTTKVCTFVGRISPSGGVHLLGYGLVNAHGLHKGVVVDLEPAQEAVSASVQEAQRSSGVPFTSAYVGITGAQVLSTTTHGETLLSGSRPITARDLRKAQTASKHQEESSGGETLHAIPLGYTVDGLSRGSDPLGVHGLRLGVETHVISTALGPLWNLRKAVSGAGISVRGLVLEPIASGEAVLSDEERNAGVAVADMGGGTTDIALFHQSKVVQTAILPVAGYQITNDISLGLPTPFVTAESVKITYGGVFPSGNGATFQVPSFGFQSSRSVSRLELSLLIRERVTELLRLAFQRLRETGYLSRMPAGLVLTGGTAQLPDLARLAQEVLGLPVRVGHPQGVEDLPEALAGPPFATAVGILLWARREAQEESLSTSNGRHPFSALQGRVQGWLRSLFMLS